MNFFLAVIDRHTNCIKDDQNGNYSKHARSGKTDPANAIHNVSDTVNRVAVFRFVSWSLRIKHIMHRGIVIDKVLKLGRIINIHHLNVQNPRHLVWCLIESLNRIGINNIVVFNHLLDRLIITRLWRFSLNFRNAFETRHACDNIVDLLARSSLLNINRVINLIFHLANRCTEHIRGNNRRRQNNKSNRHHRNRRKTQPSVAHKTLGAVFYYSVIGAYGMVLRLRNTFQATLTRGGFLFLREFSRLHFIAARHHILFCLFDYFTHRSVFVLVIILQFCALALLLWP